MTNLIPCEELTLEKQMGIVKWYVNDLLSAKYTEDGDKHWFLEKFFWEINEDTFNEYNKIIKEKYKGNVWDFLSDYLVYKDKYTLVGHRIYDDYIVWASLLLSDEVDKIDTDMLNHIINWMLWNFSKHVWDYYNTKKIKSLYDVYNKIEPETEGTKLELYPKAVFFSLIWTYLAWVWKKWDEVVNLTYYKKFLEKYNKFIVNSYLSDGKIKKLIKKIDNKLPKHFDKEKIIKAVEKDIEKLREKLSEDSEYILFDVNNLLTDKWYTTDEVIKTLTQSIYNTNVLIDTILTWSIIKANWWNIPKTVEALVRIWTEDVTDKTIEKIVDTVTKVYDKMWIKKIDTWILKWLADIKKMKEIEDRDNEEYLYKWLYEPWTYLGYYTSWLWLIFSNYFTRVYTWQFLNYWLSTTLHEFTHLLNEFYLSSYIKKLVWNMKYNIDDLETDLLLASSLKEKKQVLKNMKEYYSNISEVIKKLFSDLSLSKEEQSYVITRIADYASDWRWWLIDELIAFLIDKQVSTILWKDEKTSKWVLWVVNNLLLLKDDPYKEIKSTINYSINKINKLLNSSEEEINNFANKAKINELYVRYKTWEKRSVNFIDEDKHLKVIDTILNDSWISLKKLITDWYNVNKDNITPKKIVFINDITPEKNTVLSSQTKAWLTHTIELWNKSTSQLKKIDIWIWYWTLDKYYIKDWEIFIEVDWSDLKQISDWVYTYINDPETVVVKLPDDVFWVYKDWDEVYWIMNENYIDNMLWWKTQVWDLLNHISSNEIIDEMYYQDVKKILPKAIEYVDNTWNKQYKKYLDMLDKISWDYVNSFYNLWFHFNLYLTQYWTIPVESWYISTDWALNTLAKMVAFNKWRMMKFVINDEKLLATLKKDINQSLNLERIVWSYLKYKNTKNWEKFEKAFDLYVQWMIRKVFPFKIDNWDVRKVLFSEIKEDLIEAYNEIQSLGEKELEKKIKVYLNRLPYLVSATEDIWEFFSVKILHDVMIKSHEWYKKLWRIESWKQSYRETFKDIINNLTPKQQEYLDFLDSPDTFIKNMRKKIWGVKSKKTLFNKELQTKNKKALEEIEKLKKRFNYEHVSEVFKEINELFIWDNTPDVVYSIIKKNADRYYLNKKRNAWYKKYANYLDIIEKTLNKLWINFYDDNGKIIASYFTLPKQDYLEKIEKFITTKNVSTAEKVVKAEEKIKDIVWQWLYSWFITNRLVEWFKGYQLGIHASNLKNIANGIANWKYKISWIIETTKTLQDYFLKRVTWEITSLDIEQYNALRAWDYKWILWAIINIAHVNYEKLEQEARRRYEILKSSWEDVTDEFVENATIVWGRIWSYEDVKDLIKLSIAAEELEKIINDFSDDVSYVQLADVVYENLKNLKEIHDEIKTNKLKASADDTHFSLVTSSFSTTYYVPTTEWLAYNVIKFMTEEWMPQKLLESISNLISSYKMVKPYELYEEISYDELMYKYIFQYEWIIKLNKQSVEKIWNISKWHLSDAEGAVESVKKILEDKVWKLKTMNTKEKYKYKYQVNNNIMTNIALLRDINNFINSYMSILNTISKDIKTPKLVSVNNKINEFVKMEKRLISDDNIGETISQVEKILGEIKEDIQWANKEIDEIINKKDEATIDLFKAFSEQVEKNVPTNNKIIEVPVVKPVEYEYYKKVWDKYERHKAIINEVRILKFNEQDLYLWAYEINLKWRLYRFLNDKEKDLDKIITGYIEADDKIKYIEKEFKTFNWTTTDFIKKALDFIIDKESFRDDTYAFISQVNDIEKSAEPILKIWYEDKIKELQEKWILDKFWWYTTKINELATQIDTSEHLSRWEWNIKPPTIDEIYMKLKNYYNITKQDIKHNYDIRVWLYNNIISVPINKWIEIEKKPNVIKWDSDWIQKYEVNNIYVWSKKVSWEWNTHLVILNSEDINWQTFSLPNTLSSNEGLLFNVDTKTLTINLNKYIKELTKFPSDERNKFIKELKNVYYWLNTIKNKEYDIAMKKNIDIFNTNYHANLILSIYLSKLLDKANSLDEFKKTFKALYVNIYNSTNFWWVYKKLWEALEKLEKTWYYEKALKDDEMKEILKTVKIIDDYKQEVAWKIVEDLLWEHSEFDKYLGDVFNTFKDVYDLWKKISNKGKEDYSYLSKIKKYTSNIKAKQTNKKLTELEEKYTNLAKNFVEWIWLQEKIQSMKEWFINVISEQDQKYLNEVLNEVQNKQNIIEKIKSINNKLNKLWEVRWDYYFNERVWKEIPSYKPIVKEENMEYYLSKVKDELRNFDEWTSIPPCTLND